MADRLTIILETLREATEIQRIINTANEGHLLPDYTLRDELKTLLVFTSKAKRIGRLSEPDDLQKAQVSLSEINEYRDRALFILLSALTCVSTLEWLHGMARQIVILHPAVSSKTESIKKTATDQVIVEVSERLHFWESTVKQAELVVRNCRDAYFATNAQCENARTLMGFKVATKDMGAGGVMASDMRG